MNDRGSPNHGSWRNWPVEAVGSPQPDPGAHRPRRRWRGLALLGGCAGVAGIVGALTLASATPAAASHSWGNYHWARTSNPFTLNVVDSVTSSWDGYLNTALADWSLSTVLGLVNEPGDDDNGTRKKCQAPTGKVRVCNAAYGFNGWLGLAQIWVSGNHITKGTSKMNDSYFNYPDYNTPAWRQYVMCQEPGHTLGLGHQDENHSNANLGSCMDYTSDPDGPPSNEHPNTHDYDQLAAIYTHLDSFTTIASGDPESGTGGNGKGRNRAMVDDDEDVPPWAGPQHGNVYERDLGGGRKTITYVIWVKPGLPGAR